MAQPKEPVKLAVATSAGIRTSYFRRVAVPFYAGTVIMPVVFLLLRMPFGPLVPLLACVPAAVWASLAVLGLYRHAAWLDGTTLAVQGALRTHRCDLASAAAVRVREHTNGFALLLVRAQGTSKPLHVRLETVEGMPLPAAELRLLADAVIGGRPRPELENETLEAVEWLERGAEILESRGQRQRNA